MARGAEERHTAAFVVGALLGGTAGAAATLWRAPQAGIKTRIAIAEGIEGVLFRLTGMDQWNPETSSFTIERPPSSVEDPTRAAAPSVEAAVAPPAPAAVSGAVAEEERLPPTFRGLPLNEQRTDVVVDGPRPAPGDRR